MLLLLKICAILRVLRRKDRLLVHCQRLLNACSLPTLVERLFTANTQSYKTLRSECRQEADMNPELTWGRGHQSVSFRDHSVVTSHLQGLQRGHQSVSFRDYSVVTSQSASGTTAWSPVSQLQGPQRGHQSVSFRDYSVVTSQSASGTTA